MNYTKKITFTYNHCHRWHELCVEMVMMPLYITVPNKGLELLCDGSTLHWLIGPIFLFSNFLF